MSPPSQDFPTRQYRYPQAASRAFESVAAEIELQAGTVYRFVLGRDEVPQPMSRDEIEALHDPFARLALARGELPLTLKAVVAHRGRLREPEGSGRARIDHPGAVRGGRPGSPFPGVASMRRWREV